MPELRGKIVGELDNSEPLLALQWGKLYYICSDQSYTYWTSDVYKAALFYNLKSFVLTAQSLQ